MAASWAALLKTLQERQEGGKALTPAVVWKEFKRQAARSNRQDVKRLAEVGEGMTPEDRGLFAAAVMPLLVTLDWPLAWEAARADLVLAVEALVEEADTKKPDRFAGLTLNASPSSTRADVTTMFSMAWLSLHTALNMLRRPSPPSELQNIARLCELGTSPAAFAFEVLKRGKKILSAAHIDGCNRYLESFERYARAARAMNDAVGAVLFHGLDLGTAEDP